MPVKADPPIMDLEDFTESINACIYGDSGVGKTVLAGSDNVLFLATEDGTISAKRQGSKAKIWRIRVWEDLDAAYVWLLENPDHGFDWIVIDSVTVMQRLLIKYLLREIVAENSNRDIDIPAIQDHQKWQNMFKRFVEQFNELPCNVLYTATAMRKEDAEGDDLILPDLQGKDYQISAFLCASVGVLGYMRKFTTTRGDETTETRKVLFQSSPPYTAKDRYDCLGRWYTISVGDRQVHTLRDIRLAIIDSSEYAAAKSGNKTPAKAAAKKAPAKAPAKRAPAKTTPIKRTPAKKAS